MGYLNDNVFQNIESKYKYDTKLYQNHDTDSSNFKKDPLEIDEKQDIAKDFCSSHNLEKQALILNLTLDKILVTHRNSKLFLFMLSGPFFVLFYFIKLSLKVFIMYFIFGSIKKKKSKLVAQSQ